MGVRGAGATKEGNRLSSFYQNHTQEKPVELHGQVASGTSPLPVGTSVRWPSRLCYHGVPEG